MDYGQSWIIEFCLVYHHHNLFASQIYLKFMQCFGFHQITFIQSGLLQYFFVLFASKPFLFLTNQLSLLFCFSYTLWMAKQFCFPHTVWMAKSFSFSRFWYKHHFLISLSNYMNITGEIYVTICVIIVLCLSFHWNLGLIRPCPFFLI